MFEQVQKSRESRMNPRVVAGVVGAILLFVAFVLSGLSAKPTVSGGYLPGLAMIGMPPALVGLAIVAALLPKAR